MEIYSYMKIKLRVLKEKPMDAVLKFERFIHFL